MANGYLWLPLAPTWLERALGADMVVRAAGWEHRSRSTGGYGDLARLDLPGILGIQRHHTANPVDRDIHDVLRRLAETHPFAPVGAFCIEKRTGRWGVVAAGATNTSGRSEAPMPCSGGTVPTSQGNRFLISIEADNDGVGEEWTPDMLDSYNLGVAALVRGLRDEGAYDAHLDRFVPIELDPTHPGDHGSHDEYTARKIDPAHGSIARRESDRYARPDDPRYGRWEMDWVRRDTAAIIQDLDNSPTGDDDMPIITSYTAADIAHLNFRHPVLIGLQPVTLSDGSAVFPSAAQLKLSVVGATHPGRVELAARGVAFVDEDGDGVVDLNRGSFPAAIAGMGAFPISTLVGVDPFSGQVRLRLNGSPTPPGAPEPSARVVVGVEAVWAPPSS